MRTYKDICGQSETSYYSSYIFASNKKKEVISKHNEIWK
jgi:hypothetical protein